MKILTRCVWRKHAMAILPCDIFLGAHGSYFDLETKYARIKNGAPSPLIDPDGYKKFVAQKEQDFRAELAKQKAVVSESAPPR